MIQMRRYSNFLKSVCYNLNSTNCCTNELFHSIAKNFFISYKCTLHNCNRTMYVKTFCTLAKAEDNPLNNSGLISENDNFVKSAYYMQAKQLTEFIKNNEFADKLKWEKLENDILQFKSGDIKKNSLGSQIIEACYYVKNLSLGRSYVDYLLGNGVKLNIGIVCYYLKLCAICRPQCTISDVNRVKHLADNMLRKFTSTQYSIRESLIIGYSITDEWKKSLELFNKYDKDEMHSTDVYTTILTLLMDKGNMDQFWNILDNGIEYKLVSDDLYFSYLEKYKADIEMIKKLFRLFNSHNLIVSFEVAEKIRHVFAQLPDHERLYGKYTLMKNEHCNICKQKLNEISLDKEEFDMLRTEFLNKIVIGKDAFLLSTPKEIHGFIHFIKGTAPYDVVIDSLNVAYIGNIRNLPHRKSRLMDYRYLETVVQHFLDRKKKVLVIGRKHMIKWPESFLKYLNKYAGFYLINNSSKDDPLILYATLYSGPDAHFVSRDLMRFYKDQLRNPKLISIFKRWQLSRQYKIKYINIGVNVLFQDVLKYQMTVQQSENGGWHIPYLSGDMSKEESYEFHKSWLCLRRNQEMK